MRIRLTEIQRDNGNKYMSKNIRITILTIGSNSFNFSNVSCVNGSTIFLVYMIMIMIMIMIIINGEEKDENNI